MEEYLPYFDNLDKKYKDIYMEWSKEKLIDHLIANIKNGEVLLSRIDKAIEYIENGYLSNGEMVNILAQQGLLEILIGDD